MQAPSHYAVLAMFKDGIFASYGDIQMHFTDAAHKYADAMTDSDVAEAVVMFIDPTGEATKDVTENARAKVAQWYIDNRDDLPAWLSDEPPVCKDCGHERCTCDDKYDEWKNDNDD